MGQSVRISEQYLLQIAADLRIQMSEINALREAIQSAEAIKALRQSAVPDPLLSVRGWAASGERWSRGQPTPSKVPGIDLGQAHSGNDASRRTS